MVSLLGADRPPEASCMADKARSAFFKALLRVLSFPAVSTFLENLFARGGLGPIGVFRVGPLHDRTGSGHPDHPDSSLHFTFFICTSLCSLFSDFGFQGSWKAA